MLKKQQIRTIIFLTIPFVVGLFMTCSKNPKCWGKDKNKGIITSSILIACEPTVFAENYIITSDSLYQKTFLDTTTGQPNCNLPFIDFNTSSLLGQRVSGQCELKIIREVTRLDEENKYNYKVTVKNCGLCKMLVSANNWVTVPKLPNGWTVSFETKEK